jgi:hypothetical protein
MVKKFLLALSIIWTLLIGSAYAQTPNSVDIEVTRNSVEDTWLVRYKFSEPIFDAIFYPHSEKLRKTLFEIKTPGVSILTNDQYERLIVSNPMGITELTVTHKTYEVQVHQTYEFHTRFSESDIVAYSGYYNLYNLRTSQGWKIPDRQSFNFKINRKGYVMANGKRGNESITWEATPAQPATFVYFGQTEPVGQNGFQLLIDPHLPEWVRLTYADLFPKMVEFYSKALYQLPEEIWGVIAYDGRGKEFSVGGGAINGSNTTFITALGKDWNNEDPVSGLIRPVQKFIAHHLLFHEFVHMWNANNPAIKLTQPWLWEGGAEAFSHETFEKLGLRDSTVDPTYAQYVDLMYKNNLSGNFKKCISSLRLSLENKFDRLENKDFGYGCGHMIGILTDRALKQKSSSQDIFSFWKELFQKSFQSGRPIDTQTYLDALDKKTENETAKKTVHTLLTGVLDAEMASGQFLASALTALGETFHLPNSDK